MYRNHPSILLPHFRIEKLVFFEIPKYDALPKFYAHAVEKLKEYFPREEEERGEYSFEVFFNGK